MWQRVRSRRARWDGRTVALVLRACPICAGWPRDRRDRLRGIAARRGRHPAVGSVETPKSTELPQDHAGDGLRSSMCGTVRWASDWPRQVQTRRTRTCRSRAPVFASSPKIRVGNGLMAHAADIKKARRFRLAFFSCASQPFTDARRLLTADDHCGSYRKRCARVASSQDLDRDAS